MSCKSYALLECLGNKFRAAVRGHKLSVKKNIRLQARCHQNQGRKGFPVFLDDGSPGQSFPKAGKTEADLSSGMR